MTGLSASTTWALMLHLASAALAMQCGFVPEAAALIALAEAVDKNALLLDALRLLDAWTSCLAAIALVSSCPCEMLLSGCETVPPTRPVPKLSDQEEWIAGRRAQKSCGFARNASPAKLIQIAL